MAFYANGCYVTSMSKNGPVSSTSPQKDVKNRSKCVSDHVYYIPVSNNVAQLTVQSRSPPAASLATSSVISTFSEPQHSHKKIPLICIIFARHLDNAE